MDQKFLEHEMENYKKEQEKVKKLIGSIGATHSSRNHKILNGIFLIVVVGSFFAGGVLHYIPFNLSIELGVLLVSIKIAWMIHEQQKVNHFQFWILNSIELRLNSLQTNFKKLQKEVKKHREETERVEEDLKREEVEKEERVS
ncbi:hypothetical protein PM10SUCC1_16510 [Propionigenium maris DSM 9537]|uniref:Uncharacterized protein n=1 Tax=Propionigenium maris DSM 9537 TaxID=1123000 RepID=A0A9W6GKZ4_9FUSO|nr:hypothetical protein [Propionigenium maris]GLI56137.1 hypothetical protein PM10SUCC1_16510 [Propionigenium maris DSM 9537]